MGLFDFIKNKFRKKEVSVQDVVTSEPQEAIIDAANQNSGLLEVQSAVSEIVPDLVSDAPVNVEVQSDESENFDTGSCSAESEVHIDQVEVSEPLPSDNEDTANTEFVDDDFPEWLLDESMIPPEKEMYIPEDDFPLDWESLIPAPDPAQETVPEPIKSDNPPQIFIGSHNKISDLLCVLRRYPEGIALVFCRSSASVSYLRDVLSSVGQASTDFSSNISVDIRETLLRESAAANILLITDDISQLRWQGSASVCAIFYDMPEGMSDYRDKLQAASVSDTSDAVFAFYSPADYVVARHHIMHKFTDSAECSQRLNQLDELRTWFISNGTQSKELSRKITVETSTEQTMESCSGIVFAVTGKVNKFADRNAIMRYVVSHGGIFGERLTKDTHYLITNDTSSGSKKNQKAAQYGTKIISEDDFIRMFCGGKVPENDNN